MHFSPATMHDFFTTTAACGSAVFDGQPQDLTTGAVAEIYGGKGEIEESMTSTRINIPAAADNSLRPLALAGL